MKPVVWIIDDEQGICVSLSLALKKEYQISTFNSAAPALKRMETQSCDVVLLDLNLQEEDGIEVLRQIKQKHPSVSVIMMTASGSAGTSANALEAGAYTYLTKPLDLDLLKCFLSQAIQAQKMSEQIRYLSNELQICQKVMDKSDTPTQHSYPSSSCQQTCNLKHAAIVTADDCINMYDLLNEATGYSTAHQPSSATLYYFFSSISLKELERLAVVATLKKNKGRRDKTAADLGISKRGLLNKIKEYGLG